MIFNVLTLLTAAGAAAAAALDARAAVAVLYPRPGTIWTPGYAHNVTWVPTPGTGSIALVNGGNTLPLASNVDLSAGRTEIQVPRVNPGGGYIIQVSSDGDTSQSGAFEIGSPDVPGPQPSVSIASSTTLVILPSTSVVTTGTASVSSALSSITSSASSVESSIASSVGSAQSSIASSLSSVLSSATSAASSALSSVTSGASSALSSATSIRSSAASSASAAATSSPNAALGMKSLDNAKLGAVLTAGVAVIATLAGASLF